jgi:hypothetical protein
MSKAEKVRALFRTAADFGATENERQVAERFAWELLRKDESLIQEIAASVLQEAQDQGREPQWPSPLFFDVWTRTQQAKAAQASEARRQEQERKQAGARARAQAAADARAAGLRAAAAAAAASAAAAAGPPPGWVPPGLPPGPPPGWVPPGWAPPPAENRWERLKNVAAEWIGDTLEEVADGLNLVEQINEEVNVRISDTSKTVTVKVTFPVELVREIYEEHGNLDEFSRLVGVKMGEDLAQAFRDSGY